MRSDPSVPPVVLAVDDDPAIRASLGLVLEDHCRVFFAADGAEAVHTLASRLFDVVLLDLLLPGMNGHETLIRIRNQHKQTPVVVLSALADVTTVVTSMKLGAWDYVAKPWRDEELLAKVYRASAERRRKTGILLVSQDAAVLAPLQLALESRTSLLSTDIDGALDSDFLANVIVLSSPPSTLVSDARNVQERYPHAALVVVANASDENGSLEKRLGSIPAVVVRSGRLDSILDELIRLRAIQDMRPPAAVVTALAFISSHYRERIVVDDVAHAACLSEDRLAHVFRDATGLSVKDYVVRLRVAIARRLLAETDETIEDISSHVGFPDPSNFSRMFKQIDGVPPGEFRRSGGRRRRKRLET